MTRAARILSAALVAGASVLALAALSRIPYAAEDGKSAVLRLSWRFRGERVEECRRLSTEELAQLPAHMRREVVCEGRVAPFVLAATLDGAAVAQDTIRASGAHADRPLYVFREVPIAPGAHRLHVRFQRLARAGDGAEQAEDRAAELRGPPLEAERAGEGAERARDGKEEDDDHGAEFRLPPREDERVRDGKSPALALDTRFHAAAGEVVLVTYEAELDRLVLRHRTP